MNAQQEVTAANVGAAPIVTMHDSWVRSPPCRCGACCRKDPSRRPRPGYTGPTRRARGGEFGTTAVVLEVLRAACTPLTAKEIVERAGDELPTKAKGEHGRRNVVTRDLCRELARGDASRVVRFSAENCQRTTWAVRS